MKTKITILALMLIGMSQLRADAIAVLPYKISYEGRLPKKYTQAQLDQFIYNESRNYQVSMINYLVKMNRKNKNAKLNMSVLSQSQVDALLLSKKISPSKLDSLTNAQLAEILGVTYVVRGAASRNFIMSDEMSLGIQAAQVLVGGVTNGLPVATSNISIVNSFENLNSGNIEFSKQFSRNASPTYRDEQNLRDAFRYSARKMFKTMRKKQY